MSLSLVLITPQRHTGTSTIAEEYLCNNNDFVFMQSLNNSIAFTIRYQVREIDGHVHFKNCDRLSIVQSSECRFVIKRYLNSYDIIEQNYWKDEDWKAYINSPSHHF
ncbi:unnamed protein product [Rotaria magnacalcarata]|uniref:Uncharacterized protein n=1 Tax=Rotaria magnacalcarata TaxID=392030 RepID=A0A8S2VY83_9BILA|nr:unnamed protein product [Rotaria magnacalcarata]